MKILHPIDGSPAALQALRQTLQWALQGLRAEFVLVNVQEPASLYELVVAHDAAVIERMRADAGADLLRSAEALLDAAGLSYESEVAGGAPAALIVELAENYGCDMVVMGARGVGAPDAGGLGSVAGAVLLHSPLPVMVVRAGSVAASANEGEAADG